MNKRDELAKQYMNRTSIIIPNNAEYSYEEMENAFRGGFDIGRKEGFEEAKRRGLKIIKDNLSSGPTAGAIIRSAFENLTPSEGEG